MFKLLRLKWNKENAELRYIHQIEMKNKEAELERMRLDLASEHDRKTREVISLMKQDSEKKYLQLENSYEEKFLKLKQALLDDNYQKMSQAMSKLHEEGNVTTRFTQDLALRMMDGMPKTKVENKVITSGSED